MCACVRVCVYQCVCAYEYVCVYLHVYVYAHPCMRLFVRKDSKRIHAQIHVQALKEMERERDLMFLRTQRYYVYVRGCDEVFSRTSLCLRQLEEQESVSVHLCVCVCI